MEIIAGNVYCLGTQMFSVQSNSVIVGAYCVIDPNQEYAAHCIINV